MLIMSNNIFDMNETSCRRSRVYGNLTVYSLSCHKRYSCVAMKLKPRGAYVRKGIRGKERDMDEMDR